MRTALRDTSFSRSSDRSLARSDARRTCPWSTGPEPVAIADQEVVVLVLVVDGGGAGGYAASELVCGCDSMVAGRALAGVTVVMAAAGADLLCLICVRARRSRCPQHSWE